jgi:hypothetical protein
MPQWARSVCVSRHWPAQSVVPAAQDSTHWPLVHTCPAAHALPQAPQLSRSVRVLAQYGAPPASTPASPWAPQRASMGPHSSAQRPMAHTCPAGHALPQAPQWARSVSVLTHTLLLQRVCVPGQLCTQAPALHTWPAAQALPHAPQCWALVRVSTQAPPQANCGAAHCTSTVASRPPPSPPTEDEHAIYVHAGLPTDSEGRFVHPREAADPFALLWARTAAFFRDYRGKRVVVGHTHTMQLPPELSQHTVDDPTDVWAGPSVVALDTGCGRGGFLSALELPSMTVYESRDRP